MKKILFVVIFFFFSFISFSQNNDTTSVQKSDTYYLFIKTDGAKFIGKILRQNDREILILTQENKKIYIPQYEIRKTKIIKPSDYNISGEYVGEDEFSTRYYISTNGLPISKGEGYVQWNWFGPNFQYGISENLDAGLITSWVGAPLIGTIKKNWILSERKQFSVGGLFGSIGWFNFSNSGILPFASLSFGDRSRNTSISGGFLITNSDKFICTSLARMTKISQKISLVFESFLCINNNRSFVILIPGFRWHQADGKAFQLGFGGVTTNYGDILGIPMIQWYRTL